jgi:hypothetical protein
MTLILSSKLSPWDRNFTASNRSPHGIHKLARR